MVYKLTIVCDNNIVLKILEFLNFIEIMEKEEIDILC